MINNIWFTDYEFNNKLKYLIWSVSYYSPTESLEEIKKLFIELNYQGIIVFDLLLCNGNNWNRFCFSDFENEEFSKFEILTNKEEIEYIKHLSSAFYYKNSEFLENSILSKVSKFLIRKGRVI